jgi:hypothetical protein
VQNRFRWFGHVERKSVDSIVRRVYQIEDSHITRVIGRPRRTITETIRKYIHIYIYIWVGSKYDLW